MKWATDTLKKKSVQKKIAKFSFAIIQFRKYVKSVVFEEGKFLIQSLKKILEKSLISVSFNLESFSQTINTSAHIWYWQNVNNYWTFVLSVRAHCINSAKSLVFFISGAIKHASVSTNWWWHCASTLQHY